MDTQVARQLDTRKVQRGGKVTRSKQKLRLQIGHAGSETRVGHTLTAKTSTADRTRRKRNVGWSHAHSKNFDCGSDTQEAKRRLVTRSQQKLRLRIGHAGSETRVGHTLTAKTSTADRTRRKRNAGWSHAHSKNFDCGLDTQEAKRGLVTRSQQKLRLRIGHAGSETRVGHTLTAKTSTADSRHESTVFAHTGAHCGKKSPLGQHSGRTQQKEQKIKNVSRPTGAHSVKNHLMRQLRCVARQ
jgi:hypothetical protein